MDKKQTFIAAIQNNERAICKIAAVYTHTTEDRNDLMQEIIYQLWKTFDRFQQRASMSTWVYRVALNVAIQHLNSTNRKVVTIPLQESLTDMVERDSNETEEKWQILKQHLDNLNLLDKGLVLLYLENKSYEEIGAIMGLTTTNVGTRFSRIKERLRNKIAKQL